MTLPTLDQLYTIFRDHALPAEIDPTYKDATVAGIRVCGAEDAKAMRFLGYKDNPDNLLALDFGKPFQADSFRPFDDLLYRRYLSGTGGLAYRRTTTDKQGNEITLGPTVLDLCRDDTPATGAYAVYATTNSILNNNPEVPGFREVAFDFEPAEIIALVKGLKLDNKHYGVDEETHRKLLVFPDMVLIDAIHEFLKRPDCPIAPERRAAMAAAFDKTMAYEKKHEDQQAAQIGNAQQSLDLQKGMRSEMRWQMIGMAALTVYTTLLALGKAGSLNYILAFPFRAIFTPIIEGAVNLFNRAADRDVNWRWTAGFYRDVKNRLRYQGLSTVTSTGTNLTEAALLGEIRPAADKTTPEMAELLERRLRSTRGSGSAVFEAPPGWGKEVLMRNLALRNPDILIMQISSDNLQAGTMYRGTLEQKLDDIPKEIERAQKKGQIVWLMIDEFHESALAGRSEHDSRTLLERWKGPLARGTLRIAGFSTPSEMLKLRYIAGMYDDPSSRRHLETWEKEALARFETDPKIAKIIELRPLLERFQKITARPRSQEDVTAMIEDEIAFRQKNGEHVEIDHATASFIASLAQSDIEREGFIPRRALDNILSGTITQLSEKAPPEQTIRVTIENVSVYVAQNYPAIAARAGVNGAPAESDEKQDLIKAVGADRLPVNAPLPQITYTQTDFETLLKAKFRNIELTVDPATISTLAKISFQEWERQGRPMDNVDGHLYPSEGVLEDVLERVNAVVWDASVKESFEKAIRESDERRERGERFTDALPKEFKGMGK